MCGAVAAVAAEVVAVPVDSWSWRMRPFSMSLMTCMNSCVPEGPTTNGFAALSGAPRREIGDWAGDGCCQEPPAGQGMLGRAQALTVACASCWSGSV